MSLAKACDFEALVLPHLDAAFNLARWLVNDQHVAEDLVQDSYLRAYRYIESLQGDNARPWLLGIVRNCCFTWLEEQRMLPNNIELDDEIADTLPASEGGFDSSPEKSLARKHVSQQIDAAIKALAPPFREVVILRELEDLSYAEIAQIASLPIGTVMSRLARARAELRTALADLKGST